MKKNVFRILALMLAFAMIIGTFAACGGNGDEDDTSTSEEISDDISDDASEEESEDESENGTDDESTEAPSNGEENTTPDDGNGGGTTATKPEGAQAILAAYTRVMDKAKAEAPAYTKKEFQEIPNNENDRKIHEGNTSVINFILGLANNAVTTESSAKEDKREKGADMKWFPVVKNSKGCLLTDVSAIKSATSELQSDGKIKLVITLHEENKPEPTPENTNNAPSATGAMFNPLSSEEIGKTLSDTPGVNVQSYDLLYYDCTATIVYNPENDQLDSLEQLMTVRIDANGTGLGFIKFNITQNLYSTARFWDFTY